MSVIENKNGRSNEPIRCKKKIQKIDYNNKIDLKMKMSYKLGSQKYKSFIVDIINVVRIYFVV